MNRSILIVICDFIITSMIYLNGGFSAIESPFQDGGGATIDRSAVNVIIAELENQRAELEKARAELIKKAAGGQQAAKDAREVRRLSGELANVRSKLEFMERRARLNRENAGPLTPMALQKELEEEIRQKNLAQARYEQKVAELAASKESLLRNDRSLGVLREQHNALLKELAARASSLENTQNKLSSATGEVAKLTERLHTREAELKHRDLEIRHRENDLRSARQEITNVRLTAQGYRKKISNVENELAFLRGRSNAMEKELANTRDRLLASEKNIKAREIELAAARTRLENMQNVLKNAVSDLTAARTRLAGESASREQAQTQLARLKGDYNAVSVKLQNAEKRLRSDVLTRYAAAAVRLRQHVREKRLLVDRKEDTELYLPAVNIYGKNYLVTALRAIAGSRQNSSALSEVVDLKYLTSAANGGSQAPEYRISNPILIEKSDCRVALMQIDTPAVKPLTVLTKDALKRRGIQDLYLFKAKSFGKDSTILDSRCSMSFESDDDYLYIRNGARVSSELKAEIGDLVLTKQGELAAVVVALENYDFDRQQEARCFVFSQMPDIQMLPQIRVSKSPDQKDYRDFSDKLNFFLEQAAPLNARKRRR
ncbi:MAG: hypothetical protein IKA65_03300 [Lentisphaeria bacterium]|nr:hypothetical protein [Lentisphaeria bacterium]